MQAFNVNDIVFICEQDGTTEREFKKRIISLLHSYPQPVRAYLAQVRYSLTDTRFNVVLCIACENGEDTFILNEATKIFQAMFGKHEHLDILFLATAKEQKIRQVCTPFFVSKDFHFPHPDYR